MREMHQLFRPVVILLLTIVVISCKKSDTLPEIDVEKSDITYTVQLSGSSTEKLTTGYNGPANDLRQFMDNGPQFIPVTGGYAMYDIAPRVDYEHLQLFFKTGSLAVGTYNVLNPAVTPSTKNLSGVVLLWKELALGAAGVPVATYFNFYVGLPNDYLKIEITNIRTVVGSNASYTYYDGTIDGQFNQVVCTPYNARYVVPGLKASLKGTFKNLRVQANQSVFGLTETNLN